MKDDVEHEADAAVEEGWFPDPDDLSGSWLRYWDGEQWSEVPPRLASQREREVLSWPAPPAPQTLDEAGEVRLDQLLLLGGHGFSLLGMSRYDLVFGPTEAVIEGPGQDGVETTEILYAEMTNLSIQGPGKIREGGDFIGGGFGIEGFFIGAATASVLNSLTTRSRIETLIGLQLGARELIFLCTTVEPGALQLQLSRVRGLLRDSAPRGHTGGDLGTQLTKLADLVERGFLERGEYDEVKRRLLDASP